MILVRNASKIMRNQVILDNITLEVKDGTCCGFVGYNGCGKTMLLRAICGFFYLDSGTVEIDGKICKKDYDFIPDAGVAIGESQMLKELTGFENLKVLAEIQKKVSDDEILDTLRKFGVYESRNKKVRRYSLGMKQRLRLAQAFMENPRMLVLDEPFNGLDKKGAEEIRALILEEKKKGKIILLTSHDERDIDLLCDAVYELDHGKVIREEIK